MGANRAFSHVGVSLAFEYEIQRKLTEAIKRTEVIQSASSQPRRRLGGIPLRSEVVNVVTSTAGCDTITTLLERYRQIGMYFIGRLRTSRYCKTSAEPNQQNTHAETENAFEDRKGCVFQNPGEGERGHEEPIVQKRKAIETRPEQSRRTVSTVYRQQSKACVQL